MYTAHLEAKETSSFLSPSDLALCHVPCGPGHRTQAGQWAGFIDHASQLDMDRELPQSELGMGM